ncbi:GEVED domain-containing protein [Luteibaculum oceani]|uniref:T9SS type A sorting domain-containing protein n=1 Tax=Luteibaculum oceani TaxID=1294296 RepID=A0A5C6VBX9_9FLAO|nr:GEVED domain-containing protein [Luteibaculum oceani]TXC81996.1 T9SS type A sorting domain-containing protein [Luteibaculum oceani]
MPLNKRLSLFFSLFLSSVLVYSQYCDPYTYCDTKFEWISLGQHKINLPSNCYSWRVDDRTATDTLYVSPSQGGLLSAKILKYQDVLVFAYVDWNKSNSFSSNETYELTGSYQDATGHKYLLSTPSGVNSGTYRLRMQVIYSLDHYLDGGGPCYNGAYHYVDITLKVTEDIPAPGGGGTYCEAKGSSYYCGFYWIANVRAQTDGPTFNNSSGCERYGDFTNKEIFWSTGNTYDVTLTNYRTTTVGVLSWVFIDWNNDYDFDDPGETFQAGLNNGTQTCTVIVPTGIPSGSRRMRVFSTLWIETAKSCGTDNYGEWEDYTVVVTNTQNPPPGCVQRASYVPAHLSNGHCTDLDTISWGAVPGATHYDFSLFPFGQSTPLFTKRVSTNMVVIPGGLLETSKNYEILAEAINPNGKARNCIKSRFTTAPDFGDIRFTPDTLVAMCRGRSLQISATVSPFKPGDTYYWDDQDNMLNNSNILDPILTATKAGNRTIDFVLTNSYGCSTRETIYLDIEQSAAGSYLKDSEGEVCVGDYFETKIIPANPDVLPNAQMTVELLDTLTGQYNPTSDVILPNGVVRLTPAAIGDYTYRIKFEMGSCVDYTNEIKVESFLIPDMPITNFVGYNSFCRSEGHELQVLNYTTGLTWNTGRKGTNHPLFESGIFNVTYTTQQGCSRTSPDIEIILKESPAKPNIQVLTQAPFCEGTEVVLTSDAEGQKLWSTGQIDDTIRVTKSGNYLITARHPNGCSNTSIPAGIEFKNLPQKPLIHAVYPTPLCDGDSVVILNQTGRPVTWSNGAQGDMLIYKDDFELFASIEEHGCENVSETFDFSFGSNPEKPTVSASPEGPYCKGDEVTLSTDHQGTIKWSTGIAKPILKVLNSGSFVAIAEGENGCTTASDALEVTFNDNPVKPIIELGEDLISVTNAENDLFYRWFKETNEIDGDGSPELEVYESGVYTVQAKSDMGCTSALSDGVFYASKTTSVGEFNSTEFSIYPMPFDKYFNIEGEDVIEGVVIYDAQGKQIDQISVKYITQTHVEITIENPGYYIVKVKSASGLKALPVISK